MKMIILLAIISMISINALKVEGFTIDTILEENKFRDGTYVIHNSTVINLSDNKKMCPSGQCQFIMDNKSVSGGNHFSLSEEYNMMDVWLGGRLKDDITHADLTPKKQKLVEGISGGFICSPFTDIIEENGKTKYICDNKTGAFKLMYNQTYFDYHVSMSFELPSRHLSMNASAFEQ